MRAYRSGSHTIICLIALMLPMLMACGDESEVSSDDDVDDIGSTSQELAIVNGISQGQVLRVGDYITWKQFGNMGGRPAGSFAILQGDGNFVLYSGLGPGDNRGYIWGTGPARVPGPFFAIMQGDGNFVIYRGTGPGDNRGYVWGTGPHRGGNFGLYVENRRVLIQSRTGSAHTVWASDGRLN